MAQSLTFGRELEPYFARSIRDVARSYAYTKEELRVLEDADAAADEIYPLEYEAFLEHRLNLEADRVLKKYNLLGTSFPPEYGGRGAGLIVTVLCLERLGQVAPGGASLISTALGCTPIYLWGSEEQKRRYLMPALRGELILAYALTEPNVGSNASALEMKYRREGDAYVLKGEKYLISNGSIADAIITFARSEETGKVSAFIVDRSSGVKTALRLEHKIGLFTQDLAMLSYEDVTVPRENLLGGEEMGLLVAYSALHVGRLAVAAACVGAIEDCLKASIERAKTRHQFGKPIAKHQLVQQHIAFMAEALEMARWPTYDAAFKVMEWQRNPLDRELRRAADRATAIAKRVASKLAFEAADRAVQVFGGFGYSTLAPPTRHFLNLRATRLYEGTDEIMDLHVAASLLGREYEAFS
jgi:alkylation response protein AidB-like acyl-CoA dehydrogenase